MKTISYTVYPLSFAEFLHVNNVKTNLYDARVKIKIKEYCKMYLLYGGFPEIIKLKKELKIKKLQDYFNTIIYKDLIERYSISNPLIIKLFIKKILKQITTSFSVNKLYNDIKSMGYKIGNNLLYEYLEYIEMSFSSVFINKFDFSEIKQIKSEKKAYSIDNGILTALDFSFSDNYDNLFENMIAIELLKNNYEVYYFKKNRECDFIIKKNRKFIPIQVSYSLQNKETKQREVNGLIEACKFIDSDNGFIVTFDDEENTEEVNKIKINTIPAYKFMLETLN